MNPREQFSQALKAYNYGQLDVAEKLFEELYAGYPNIASYVSAYGVVLIAKGKHKQASVVLEEGLKHNPNHVDLLINLSSAYKARKRLKSAYQMIQLALKQNFKRADIHYNKANILMDAKKYDLAIDSFNKAIKFDPKLISAHYNLGNLHVYNGDLSSAEISFRKVISLQENYLPALINLGHIRADAGDFEEAGSFYEKAVDFYPENPDALMVLAKHLLDQNRPTKAYELMKTATDLDPENPDAFILLGNASKETSQLQEAEACYKKALELDPDNIGARQNLQRLVNVQIPKWHFTMLADERRNDSYQKAIEKAVNEDSVVLDVGTGSGLLALMAARAGAKSVVSCELNSRLASVARQIVKDNQFDDKIEIINKKSTDLNPDQDLPETANVLISEILDVAAIGEGMLPVIRHAARNLLTEDAKIIPSRVRLYGQLLEIPKRSKMCPVKEVSGFDLSAFDEFRVPDEYTAIQLKSESHLLLSEIIELLDYDLYNIGPAIQDNEPVMKEIEFSISAPGKVQGIVFWFDLHLDDEIVVSSRSGGELEHWGQALFCFSDPRKVEAGAKIIVNLIHSDHLIRFSLPDKS